MAKHYQGALFGKSKSRKSFFAIQLGLSVACGVKCLGFPAPERPRRVTYFNLELMPRFLQERMKAQTDALGLKPERGFFTVYNLRGRAHLLRDAFTDADGNAVTENALTRQLRDNGTDLAIIDPRYKLMQGAEDENSAQGLRALPCSTSEPPSRTFAPCFSSGMTRKATFPASHSSTVARAPIRQWPTMTVRYCSRRTGTMTTP